MKETATSVPSHLTYQARFAKSPSQTLLQKVWQTLNPPKRKSLGYSNFIFIFNLRKARMN